MRNPSKLNAIAGCKCPRCRKGEMFKHKLLSTKFMAMHKNCPVCGLEFEVEPSFFQGAMYVSYAFSVAMFITVFIFTTIVFNKPNIEVYLINISTVVILSVPFLFRYSRSIYLHLFGGVTYNPNIDDDDTSDN